MTSTGKAPFPDSAGPDRGAHHCTSLPSQAAPIAGLPAPPAGSSCFDHRQQIQPGLRGRSLLKDLHYIGTSTTSSEPVLYYVRSRFVLRRFIIPPSRTLSVSDLSALYYPSLFIPSSSLCRHQHLAQSHCRPGHSFTLHITHYLLTRPNLKPTLSFPSTRVVVEYRHFVLATKCCSLFHSHSNLNSVDILRTTIHRQRYIPRVIREPITTHPSPPSIVPAPRCRSATTSQCQPHIAACRRLRP